MATMITMPVTTTSKQGLINRWNFLRRFIWRVNDVVLSAFLQPLELLFQGNVELEHVLSGSGFDQTSTKREQKTRFSTNFSQKTVGQKMNSELLNIIFEVKASFEETVNSLDIFERYLELQSEETSKTLKLLFDREKRKGFIPEGKIDEVLNFVLCECFQNAENKTRESQKCDREISSSKASIFDFAVSTDHMPTLSKEAVSKNVEKDFTIEDILDALKSLKADDFDVRFMVSILEGKIHSQRKRLESLKIENEEVLADLGELLYLESVQRKKPGPFDQIYSFLSPQNLSVSHERPDNKHLACKNGYQNGYNESISTNSNESSNNFQEPQILNQNISPPLAVQKASLARNFVVGANFSVHESDYRPAKETIMIRAKDGAMFHEAVKDNLLLNHGNDGENQSLVTRNQLREKTSSGEGIDSRRQQAKTINVQSTSRDEATTQSGIENEVVESGSMPTPPRDERNKQRSCIQQNYEDLSFSVQQDYSSGRDCISLSNKPPTSVGTMLYNNYKLLLLTLAQSLLSSDVISLKDWANQHFSIENVQNATDVFFKLDEKGAINAEDLRQFQSLFQSINRYDLLHMIDLFLLGDYSVLQLVSGPKIRQASRVTSRYLNGSAFNAEILSPRYPFSLTPRRNQGSLATSEKPPNGNALLMSEAQYTRKITFPTSQKHSNTASTPKLSFRSRNGNHPTAHEQQDLKPIATRLSPSKVTEVFVSDGSVSHERRAMTANPVIKTNQSLLNNTRNTQSFGSNGLKLSKPQRSHTERSNGFGTRNPDTSHNHHALDQDDNWLCNHYKRHCYVKFECCDKFWPCHRCHNNQSNCGRKKLKSRDTKMVKCVYCDKEQPFGEFCCNCNAKFANYFCGLCLHLTGKDDHPYHCEKCGICRIHGDRSFHCDVCGVCLDVQLRGNHKCREGSAHDECCICLEDAFTGCQILPCSHKVHKECATQMIRRGITRCPICRESFAHKLERRPAPKSGKRF